MPRVFAAATLVIVAAVAGSAQSRSGRSVRPDGCDGSWSFDDDRVSRCEIRETTMPGFNPIDVDAGRNGGIRVRGSDRGDVFVRSRIVASGATDADARRVLGGVRVTASGGLLRAEGPATNENENWAVSFDLEVPRTAMLTLNTNNGGVRIEDFHGVAEFHARNGGITLANVGGDIHGETTNGGVTVDLEGDHWDGTGLDVRTRNGGIRLSLPANFSAQLETGTTHGRVSIDFPVQVSGTIGRLLTTTLGSGGPRLRAITTNGGVVIRQK
jgi:putative adhesin